MVAEFPAGANLKPGAADFASARFNTQKRARQPSSCRALGHSDWTKPRPVQHRPSCLAREHLPRYGKPCLTQPLSPIKRMRPGPAHLGLEEPIARLDEIIGRYRIVRRIGGDAVPSETLSSCLDDPHQPALKSPPPVPLQTHPLWRSSRHSEYTSTARHRQTLPPHRRDKRATTPPTRIPARQLHRRTSVDADRPRYQQRRHRMHRRYEFCT